MCSGALNDNSVPHNIKNKIFIKYYFFILMALKVLNNENFMVRRDKTMSPNNWVVSTPSYYSSAATSASQSGAASRPHHGYHLVDLSPWPA